MNGEPVISYHPQHLAEMHRRLNPVRLADRIVLRDGIELRVDPISRDGWMPFCLDPTNALEMDVFLRAARNRRRLLDVGAYSGTFSLVFTAREGTEALAVEPSPIVSTLRANCGLNPRHRIRVFDAALGATDATIGMQKQDLHFIGADLAPSRGDPSMVKAMAGDNLLADQRFAPDMIKIDVEGYEHQVLLGLSRTLDCFRPDLHLEVHGPWISMFGGSFDAIAALLKGHGYRMHLMDGRELDEALISELNTRMAHLFCTHRSTEWADRVRG